MKTDLISRRDLFRGIKNVFLGHAALRLAATTSPLFALAACRKGAITINGICKGGKINIESKRWGFTLHGFEREIYTDPLTGKLEIPFVIKLQLVPEAKEVKEVVFLNPNGETIRPLKEYMDTSTFLADKIIPNLGRGTANEYIMNLRVYYRDGKTQDFKLIIKRL